jgi:hypothetical protein
MNRRVIILFIVIFLFALFLAFVALAHGQDVKKNPYEMQPVTHHHQNFRSEKVPLLGKAASKFMKHHEKLCSFLGNIDIEYDKPHKFKTEKTK